jgi:hypothetical protein
LNFGLKLLQKSAQKSLYKQAKIGEKTGEKSVSVRAF